MMLYNFIAQHEVLCQLDLTHFLRCIDRLQNSYEEYIESLKDSYHKYISSLTLNVMP